MTQHVAETAKLVGRTVAVAFADLATSMSVAPVRFLVRRAKAQHISVIAEHFEPDFYLRQIRSPLRRRMAARDPLLHYVLIGWRERRAPNKRLDPRFYRWDVHADTVKQEPLFHMLVSGASPGVAQNEMELFDTPLAAVSGRALVFHHGRGGGSARLLRIFEGDLRAAGIETFRLRKVPSSDCLVIWTLPGGQREVFDITTDSASLIETARRIGITHIVVSHVIDFHPDIFAVVEGLASGLTVPLWVILHDFLCICPRVNLIDSEGHLCPGRSPDVCARCAQAGGGEIGAADPLAWRPRFTAFLKRAQRILVPSHDTREHLKLHLDLPIEVWSPEPAHDYPPVRDPVCGPHEDLRIAILGSLNTAKGSRVALNLAQSIRRYRASMHLSVIGDAENGRALKRAGVRVTGRYTAADLDCFIRSIDPNVIFLPAIWPETWSFVLSIALERGLPVVAFAHGAPYERLKALGRTDLILPLDMIEKPDAVFAFFHDLQRRGRTARPITRARALAVADH